MKISYLFVAALVMMTSSCKKYLDINRNPNVAEKVDPGLLFTTAAVQYATQRTGGDMWIPLALAGQTVSSGGFGPGSWGSGFEEQYFFDPFVFGNPWSYMFTTTGSGLNQAIALAESSTPVNNNAAAQAKTLLAMDMYDLTVLFGDIPFSEALKADIAYPHFDAQQQVLDGIIALLDEAIGQFDESSSLKISEQDLFYKGDISKWIRLAKSVKLRTLMTMVDRDDSKKAAIGQLIGDNEMINEAEGNAAVPYFNVAGRQNPKFTIVNEFFGTYDESDMVNGGKPLNPFFASERVVDFMNSISDPRLPFFFIKPKEQSEFIGLANGADGETDVHARLSSTTLQTADQPEYFFTYQEQLFFEAEIYARGLGVSINLAMADEKLRQAVEESAKWAGVSNGAAATFAASLPDLSVFSASEAVEYIHMHHWVDEMDRPLEAFVQWRRSGAEGQEIPHLTLPLGAAAGGLFRRYEYPQSNEVLANPNAPKDLIKYDEKVWFDL